METIDAILPAGGRIDPDFAKQVGTEIKALIEFGGVPILAKTLDALQASGRVRNTVVIGPDAVLQSPAAAQATYKIAEGATGPENIFRGLDALLKTENPPEKVMIVTTDQPFLSPELIQKFLDLCPKDRDICVPLIRKSEYEARFPGSSATFVPLKDDSWTTGGIFLLNVEALKKSRSHIDRVFENRKSKIGMAKLLGPGFVLKWLTKRLTLQDVEKKIESLIQCSGAAVAGSPPELAYDIDYFDDYEYAMKGA